MRGLRARIAAAIVATSVLAIVLLAAGVLVIGGDTFNLLMDRSGVDTADAQSMFDRSVTVVVALAALGAIVASIVVAMVLARRVAEPLRAVDAAAQRVAAGDYAARAPAGGAAELASVAASFNRMAASLQEQERIRREFIANAAHELRTPLTNLTGYLEALRDGVIAPDAATFESLREETERLVRLSDSLDVLAAGDARLTGRRRDPVDLAALVRSALELAAPGFDRAGVTVEASLPAMLPVPGDPDALAQVLGNLLRNAQRYTPGGGRVRVEAGWRDREVRVAIDNTGEGIPPEDLPHVFERFYRVDKSRDRAHGGSGIGLAIVQQLVEAAGGGVGATSEDGVTRFWFTLPAAEG